MIDNHLNLDMVKVKFVLFLILWPFFWILLYLSKLSFFASRSFPTKILGIWSKKVNTTFSFARKVTEEINYHL